MANVKQTGIVRERHNMGKFKLTALDLVVVLAYANALPALKKKVNPEPPLFAGLNSGKIVGGVEAVPGEFPWIVDMRQGYHYCAGSIISPEWVVTAAHCSLDALSEYTLTAGDHNITYIEGTEQTRQVVSIIVHESYGSPQSLENDIALMRVDPPFVFNNNVQPVPLPPANFTPTAKATVTGWGALREGGSSPSVLMKVDVPYVDDTSCNVSYSGSIAPSMVCYGEGGKDSCQGDSGGPIMGGPNNTLIGIVSWGSGCARPGYPGVYTEVSHYADWIRGHTVPTAEDPSPVADVTSCGVLVEASSGNITLQNLTAGQSCVITLKLPRSSSRLILSQSSLASGDVLLATKIEGGQPSTSVQNSEVGRNYTEVGGGIVLLSVSLNQTSDTTRSLRLQVYSSGYGQTSVLSGHAVLITSSPGNYSDPSGGGNYQNNEHAVIALSGSANRTLTFTSVSLEGSAPNCPYDAVAVYTLQNNQYTQAARTCGSVIPSPVSLGSGVAFITFVSDYSIVSTGFSVSYA